MALLFNSKTLTLDENGVLWFTTDGLYTINFRNFVQVQLDEGQTTNIDADLFATLSIAAQDANKVVFASLPQRIDLAGINFIEADEVTSGGAETSVNVDDFLGRLLTQTDAGTLASILTVDGSKANAFKVLWEFLDDGYTAGNNPFDIDLNENFVRLGVEYVNYLEAGGEPLTFTMAKFTADGDDADTHPERAQSMHDNLLGNLTGPALQTRFGSDPALLAELQALIPDEYENRPFFDGNDGSLGDPFHDGARAFDYDKGWDRPDYLNVFLGEVDARATNGGLGIEMIFGDGNSTVNYAVTRHEGAGVELALKAKIRGLGDYDSDHTTPNGDGTVTYLVEAGEGAPGRTTWNIDWAATVTEAGDDEDGLSFKLLLDVDPTAGEEFFDLLAADPGVGNEYTPGKSGLLQNSWNYGFLPDDVLDPANSAGTFTARLEAYDDGALIAEQTIYVVADSLDLLV